MSVFQADCPHCGTKSVAFTILHESFAGKERIPIWDTLAVCARCTRGVMATFETSDRNGVTAHLMGRNPHMAILLGLAPSPPETGAPDHTPENVARFFAQGMENLPGNWDAAGLMFRRALEAGLKNKFPDIKGKLSLLQNS